MERHHLFPKAHLARLGIRDNARANTIANMSFVDWSDNLAISDQAPAEYWPTMTAGADPNRLKRQVHWHALPVGWEQLGYDEFCEKRRKLIAAVVREGFQRLWDHSAEPAAQSTSLRDTIGVGESNVLEFKERARWSHGTDKPTKSEHVIVKSITGFMNAEGGTLLIGVADSGTVVGVEADYATLSKPNRDGYELFLSQLVIDKITGSSPALCRITFHQLDGNDVCRIDVAASAKPVFACPTEGRQRTDFWVRQGNRTIQLHGTEQQDYISEHWG